MLILSRGAGESIEIGDSIRITITRVRGARVQIGIEAPATTQVVRSELARRQQSQSPAPPLSLVVAQSVECVAEET